MVVGNEYGAIPSLKSLKHPNRKRIQNQTARCAMVQDDDRQAGIRAKIQELSEDDLVLWVCAVIDSAVEFGEILGTGEAAVQMSKDVFGE